MFLSIFSFWNANSSILKKNKRTIELHWIRSSPIMSCIMSMITIWLLIFPQALHWSHGNNYNLHCPGSLSWLTTHSQFLSLALELSGSSVRVIGLTLEPEIEWTRALCMSQWNSMTISEEIGFQWYLVRDDDSCQSRYIRQ